MKVGCILITILNRLVISLSVCDRGRLYMMVFSILASELSKPLESAMKTREPECFQSDVTYAMRFLDLRLKDGLKKEERDRAIKLIFRLDARFFGSPDTIESGMIHLSLFASVDSVVELNSLRYFIFRYRRRKGCWKRSLQFWRISLSRWWRRSIYFDVNWSRFFGIWSIWVYERG